MREARRGWLPAHLRAMRDNRPGAVLLVIFSLAIAAGTWLGTPGLDLGLRIFLMLLAIVTMMGCGIGYLFTSEDEAPPSERA